MSFRIVRMIAPFGKVARVALLDVNQLAACANPIRSPKTAAMPHAALVPSNAIASRRVGRVG
jgi:hypothetical protein